jgi:hypothetical protein
MASSVLARVSGVVLALPEPRRGISTKSGDPVAWEIATANILVANQNVTVVQLPRRDDHGRMPSLVSGAPGVGEQVDYLVELSVYGQDVQARVLSDFPAEIPALSL